MCTTERTKNTAPIREQLEKVSLEGKSSPNSLKKETCRTGGPEKGQKGQWKQLPTSASANQPANMKDTWALSMGDGVGLVKALRPDPKPRPAKDPSRD